MASPRAGDASNGRSLPITILQSAPIDAPDWVRRCMASVKTWAYAQGYAYEETDDALFDWVKPSLQEKLAGRGPILADLGRLRWMESNLAEHKGMVFWIDADTINLDPEWSIPEHSHSVFGEECWIQKNKRGDWRRYLTPHNAFMGFTADSPILPFLAYISESIIERADSSYISPQMIGPKLLKSLHNLAQFPLLQEAGVISPVLLQEWGGNKGDASACYEAEDRPALAMANLCASLVKQYRHEVFIRQLLDAPELFAILKCKSPS